MKFKILYKGKEHHSLSNNHRNAAKVFVNKNGIDFVIHMQKINKVQVGIDDVVWEEHHVFTDPRTNETITIVKEE